MAHVLLKRYEVNQINDALILFLIRLISQRSYKTCGIYTLFSSTIVKNGEKIILGAN